MYIGNDPKAMSLNARAAIPRKMFGECWDVLLLYYIGNGIRTESTDLDRLPMNIYIISSTFSNPMTAMMLVSAPKSTSEELTATEGL